MAILSTFSKLLHVLSHVQVKTYSFIHGKAIVLDVDKGCLDLFLRLIRRLSLVDLS